MRDALKKLIEAIEGEDAEEVKSLIRILTRDEVVYPDQNGWANKAYRGSLDAANELHNALLPGWRFKVEQSEIVAHGDDFTACVWPNDYTRREQVFRPSGEAPTAARAWLLAILNALEAQREHDARRRG